MKQHSADTLQTIQKCARVFRTLATIAMAFAIAGTFTALAAAIVWHRWNVHPADALTALQPLLQVIDRGSYTLTLARLISDAAGCFFQALLLCSAVSYLNSELDDGTPFTVPGALRLRKLGMLTIVLPLAGLIVRSIPYAVFDLPCGEGMENAVSVVMGIVLILGSVIFRYGAESSAEAAQA